MAAATDHTDRGHALLSASGSARWINCPPSARLEEHVPDQTSVYAQEGTLAHELADIMLTHELGRMTKGTYTKQFKAIKEHELYTDEMPDQVSKYVNTIIEAYNEVKTQTPDAVILLEQKLDYSHIVPGGYGTGDCVIIGDGILSVIDLKYGKGQKVEAKQNSQLRLYGLGALNKYSLMFDIERVKLCIIQPRLNHADQEELTVSQLEQWGLEVVKPAAELAEKGEGLQKAGSWCRWCKVKGKCATLAAANVKLARHEFKSPHLLTDEQILQVYKQIDQLTDWAAAVKAHVMQEALEGKVWPGYKLVEGRSNRVINDPTKAAQVLLGEGYSADEFTQSKLLGIGALEKLLGKKVYAELLGAFTIKPQGKPTLVDENDKRPGLGLDQAKNDFKTN